MQLFGTCLSRQGKDCVPSSQPPHNARWSTVGRVAAAHTITGASPIDPPPLPLGAFGPLLQGRGGRSRTKARRYPTPLPIPWQWSSSAHCAMPLTPGDSARDALSMGEGGGQLPQRSRRCRRKCFIYLQCSCSGKVRFGSSCMVPPKGPQVHCSVHQTSGGGPRGWVEVEQYRHQCRLAGPQGGERCNEEFGHFFWET